MGLKLGLLSRWTNIGEKCSRMAEEEIFVPKKEKATGDCRELHIEELHYVYPKLNVIRLSKSKRMCCTAGEEMCNLGCGWEAFGKGRLED